ncbi:MAG: TRAP transporter substrate-binding protein [Pseudolabrys sp.]|nr:TRAP transporter substrate-binding protein [Pseudolabrys sp.]
MVRRLLRGLAVAAVAVPLLSALAGTQAWAQAAAFPDMQLKFGHPYNEKHPLAQGAAMFAKLIGERTGGHVKVTVYPNSTIGSSRALVESMQIGVVDIALVPTTNVASFYPPLDIFYLPFMFRNAEHAYKVSDGPVGQELYDGMQKKIGIRTLAMYESGFRTITTKNTPVHKPDDMKGIKFRVVNNPLNVATFKALGANPTPMPLSEVFTGLQQGTVDGQDNPIGNVVAFGFDKVQNYITLSHHQWAGIMFLVGDKTWAKLPANVQELFKTTAIETQDWERKEVNKKDGEYLTAMKAHGMTVIELTDAETAMFQAKMKEVWDKYQAKIGEKLIKAAVDTK